MATNDQSPPAMIIKETHKRIDTRTSGVVTEIETGRSKVEIITDDSMVVDEMGLVHGGFIFSIADHAAMVAINHPNVVLGSARVTFLRPVKKGDRLIAEGKLIKVDGKKYIVSVLVYRGNDTIFTGDFTCYIPKNHILEE